MSTNKIYQTPGTAVVFKNTGGDVVLTLKNIGNGAGRISAQWDRGAGALPVRLKVEVALKYGSAVTVGLGSRIYAYGTQTSANVDVSTSDADLGAETQVDNFAPVGINIASLNAVGPFHSSHIIEVYGRYVSFAVWNASGQTLDNADGTSYITVIPFPDDIQAPA